MDGEPEDQAWRALCQVADPDTTASFKRTVNATVLILAARRATRPPARPRRAPRMAALLGIAGLIVCDHEQSLLMLIHHFGV